MIDGARGTAVGRGKTISQYVLKVHSRCDLACDHCYVYEHADQSWRHRPICIEPVVTRKAAARIAEHAATHGLSAVRVVLHGGEPLLLGEQRLRGVLAELHSSITAVTELDLRLQTNAVRLSPALCSLFSEYGVKIGVSLDGDRAANDRHRRFADGRSSYAQVRRALKLLRSPDYREIYSGILCTVDLANDPIAVLNALLREEPPRIDFLLPHGNWDNPPPRPTGAETAYADWLARIFDRWMSVGRPMPIRLFDSIEALAVGGESESEAIGPGPVDLLVIETDGSWEQADSLKSAYEGAPATGMNVFDHPVDAAAAHPAIAERQEGKSALCDTCLACPVVDRCGGGLYAHRYRSGTHFRNPSVYCSDLKSLIEHIGVPDHHGAISTVRSRAAQAAPPPVDDAPALSMEDLDAVAAGPVDRALARRLGLVHLTITRMLFAELGRRSSTRKTSAHCHAKEAWDVLCELDESAPQAVRTVLEHPFARVWALRQLKTQAGREPMRAPEGSPLTSFAMAAAIRAQRPAELLIPLHDGVAYLPTLGAWDLHRPDARTAVIAFRNNMLEVCDGDTHPRLRQEDLTTATAAPPNSTWHAVRKIGIGRRVLVEDLDPYRDCHGYPVTGRLTAAEVSRWHLAFDAATSALESWAPSYAEQADACVNVLVPLRPDTSGRAWSATSSDVFGAAGIALPARPEAMALLIVHESQHTVLNAVLDGDSLVGEQSDKSTFDVGWRPDPRPPRAALRGVFAFLALAEVWQARSVGSAADGDAARAQSRAYAAQAEQALEALRMSAALTPLGERFASGLNDRLRRLGK